MHRHLFALSLALITALTTAGQAEVRPSTPEVKADLQRVIEQQLAAFRANDFATAYSFAHTGIQAQFPVSDFEKMVRAQYPRIADSTGATFLVVIDDGSKAAVEVRVTGADGKAAEYQYLLQREDDVWRISGVIEAGVADPTPVEI